MTATKAFESVKSHAETIKNDAAHAVVTCSPGDMWAQGDIGIVCLDDVPVDAVRDDNPVAQLAPGNTQGSRHCVGDLSSVTMWKLKNSTPLDGPVIESPNGVTIEHPEHGDVTMPPGVYAIVYQRAFAEELRRVQD